MRLLAPQTHPDLIVGASTGDDAAVWRLSVDRALVFTADFITPVVDDAQLWGRIAAANSASDIYAMGGRPLLGLNLVSWNTDELGTGVLVEVLQGAAAAAAEGGWVVGGGHTVEDPHPTFGLAMLGEVHPDRILANTGLRPGDSLVLTKAIGTGVVSTAVKAGAAPDGVAAAAAASMARLNDQASVVALELGASAATDVTGFGLLGHLRRMAEASGVGAVVVADAVPVLSGARDLAEAGLVPGGTRRNLAWVTEVLTSDGVDELTLNLLADAQTSGGLLFGMDPATAPEAASRLAATGHAAAVIGQVVEGGGLTVIPS